MERGQMMLGKETNKKIIKVILSTVGGSVLILFIPVLFLWMDQEFYFFSEGVFTISYDEKKNSIGLVIGIVVGISLGIVYDNLTMGIIFGVIGGLLLNSINFNKKE